MGAGLELGRHLGIHGDHDLLLLRHEGVSLINLVVDPIPEWIADDRHTYVHDPLLRGMSEIGFVWEIRFDARSIGDKGEDLLQRKILIVGHGERLDISVV